MVHVGTHFNITSVLQSTTLGLIKKRVRGELWFKKRQEDHLQFATSHVEDTPNMWKKVLWSNVTKILLCAAGN